MHVARSRWTAGMDGARRGARDPAAIAAGRDCTFQFHIRHVGLLGPNAGPGLIAASFCISLCSSLHDSINFMLGCGTGDR